MKHWSRISILIMGVGLAVPAVASDSVTVVRLSSPAPEASLTGNLAASKDGLYLSWLEPSPQGHALRFAMWNGETFGDPRTIHTSDAFFANWADFASMVALADGGLAAHWLEKAAGGTFQYDIWMSLSDDGGITWSAPRRPHRDGTLSEHGFVSLVRQRATGFAGVWLDGRQYRDGADDNEMTLMFTTFEDGQFREEQLLDARVCSCCQTAMARTADGLFVAYRDRSPREIRDISFVRHVDGEWTAPMTLHHDGWQIPGCPVNGPQVTAAGDRLGVAWFTASNDEPRVNVVFSDDGGKSFGGPQRIDDGHPVGRVDIETLDDAVIVSWLERIEGGTGEVKLRRLLSSGASGASVSLGQTGAGRVSGFPRMAVFGGDVYVTWTEAYARRGPSRVQVAKVVIE